MKSLFSIAIVGVFVLSHFSCKKILLAQYGVKQPKIESYASLSNFLEKQDIRTKELYGFADTTAFYAKLRMDGFSAPESYFFNKNGYFVPYKPAAKSCNASVSPFLDNMATNFNTLPCDSSRHLTRELGYLVNLKTQQKVRLTDLPESDVYVVMYCAKYIGKVNKEKIWDWLAHIETIQSKTKFKITPILVSADYLDFWHITQKDIPKFAF